MIHITSRDNPAVKAIRKLTHDSSSYRKLGQYWVEGDHLCRAAVLKGVRADQVVMCESLWQTEGELWTSAGDQLLVIPDVLFASLSGLESPGKIGLVVNWTGRGKSCPECPLWCSIGCRMQAMLVPS